MKGRFLSTRDRRLIMSTSLMDDFIMMALKFRN